MSADKKNIVMISASPKAGTESTSAFLADLQARIFREMGFSTLRLDVRGSMVRGSVESDYAAMLEADAIIITFPLYIYCLPGMLMRFLQDYTDFCREAGRKNSGTRVYAVANCGFAEAWINREAIGVVSSFSRSIDAMFRFGLLIGGGGMLVGTCDAPFMRKTMGRISGTFIKMGEDIKNACTDQAENILVEAGIPQRLYNFMGNKGWVIAAKSNNLKKKDLFRKPYQPGNSGESG